jgi:hypothetical protein
MKEIGIGITTVLQTSSTPEPLYVDLWGQDPSEAAALVRSVLAECHDADIPLKHIRLPEDVWAELAADEWAMVRPPDTRLECSSELNARLEFWRGEPA